MIGARLQVPLCATLTSWGLSTLVDGKYLPSSDLRMVAQLILDTNIVLGKYEQP